MNYWSQMLSSDNPPEKPLPPTPETENEKGKSSDPQVLPILVLRNTVLFPGAILPITVGRNASLQLIRDTVNQNNLFGVISQREREVDNPKAEDLYRVGTVASILKMTKMPDGAKNIIIQGETQFRVKEFTQSKPYFKALIETLEEYGGPPSDVEKKALMHSIKNLAGEIVDLSPNLPSEAVDAIEKINSLTLLIHLITSQLQISVQEKQTLLETPSLKDRAQLLIKHLNKESQVLKVSEKIRLRRSEEHTSELQSRQSRMPSSA